MRKIKIGVLALQGAFAKHIEMLKRIEIEVCEVRRPQELDTCDGLIIPGGESTTIFRQIQFIALAEPLRQFAQKKSIFGTCAGLILMSKEIVADKMQPFGIIDISVERNAYGRQADSFQANVEVLLGTKPIAFPAFFIRAPRIRGCGEEVKVLARYGEEPILVRHGQHMAATFHPELTSNPVIHQYFVSMVRNGS